MEYLSNDKVPKLTPEAFQALLTEFQACFSKFLPYLPEEKAEITDYTRMSDSQELFISDCVTEIRKAGNSIPTVANADAIQSHLSNYNNDWAFENELTAMLSRVRNNRVIEGTLAYRGASSFYHSLEPAIIDKRQNAVEAKKRLGKYFERKSSGNKGDQSNKNG